MRYELYHDESQEDGYWHGMLLVPVGTKNELVNLLNLARSNTHVDNKISLKEVKKKNRIYSCAYSWMSIGVASLAYKFFNHRPQIYLGNLDANKRTYTFLNDIIGTKFILFCERDSHNLMTGYPDHASKIETTFRMGVKGGLHYLGCEENPIEVIKMHFDGYEHYQRHLDKKRIVGRLNGLRDYCFIRENENLIDDRSSNHKLQNSQSYEDCQLLQLTDLFVGGFRNLLSDTRNPLHVELAQPLLKLKKKLDKGYARMKNSRWFKSICISQCYLENDQWKFEDIEIKPIDTVSQLPFVFYDD